MELPSDLPSLFCYLARNIVMLILLEYYFEVCKASAN